MSRRTQMVLVACCGLILILPTGTGRADEGSAAATAYSREQRLLDADGDGQITERELAAGQQSAALLLALAWPDCDSNDDGAVSAAEFEQAAAAAARALREEQSEVEAESDQQAQTDLAGAVPLSLVLERLAADQRYADEVAALRKALANADGDEDVVTYVVGNAPLYPHLYPLVRTWVRTCPARPELWRAAKLRGHVVSPALTKPPASARPSPKAAPAGPKPKAPARVNPPARQGAAPRAHSPRHR